ncbi:hypothetical protein VNO77_03700 [Canavalia gladiata]|uniref:Uncharacterized protein n=1 Tax=Canavalia gladiata TaxID=3824 RepID=A0AAN9N0V1_CANGL
MRRWAKILGASAKQSSPCISDYKQQEARAKQPELFHELPVVIHSFELEEILGPIQAGCSRRTTSGAPNSIQQGHKTPCNPMQITSVRLKFKFKSHNIKWALSLVVGALSRMLHEPYSNLMLYNFDFLP